MLFVDLTVLSRAELLLCCILIPVTPDIYACCIRGYYGYYYYNHVFKAVCFLCPLFPPLVGNCPQDAGKGGTNELFN